MEIKLERDKMIHHLFIGKVCEKLGFDKTLELLKESTAVVDEMLGLRKADVSGSVCNNFEQDDTYRAAMICKNCGKEPSKHSLQTDH